VVDAKQSAVEWHRKILVAILQRDAEGARAAMERHLEIAEKHAEQMLQNEQRLKNLKSLAADEKYADDDKIK
jgi:DNA-binding FadR family transcriptional regulator